MDTGIINEVCCPPFDPETWQEKEIKWEGRTYVKDRLRCFFHIPLGFPKLMKRNMALIEAAGAKSDTQMIVTDACSPWRMDVYIDATKDVPGAQMTTLSGDFQAKVFEGPFKDIGKWIKAMEAYVKAKGRETKKIYTAFPTCPRCAKKSGHNYVVLLAQT